MFEREDGHLFACCPQLKKPEDSERLWEGLKRGEVSVISTDTCTFTREQKAMWEGDWTKIPMGMPGLETLMPVTYTHGVLGDRITLEEMCMKLSTNPAKIMGLYPRKGAIAVGADADIAIIHPTSTHHGECRRDGDERRLVAVRGLGARRFRAHDAVARRGDRRRLQGRRREGRGQWLPRTTAGLQGHEERRAGRRRVTAVPLAGATTEFVTTDEDLSHSPLWNHDLAPTPLSRAHVVHVQHRGAVDRHERRHHDVHARVRADDAGHDVVAGDGHDPARQHHRAHSDGAERARRHEVRHLVSGALPRGFGTKGANVPAMLRAIVACGWFGIQTWIGGARARHAVHGGVARVGIGARRTSRSRSRCSGCCRSRSFVARHRRASRCSRAGPRRCSSRAARCFCSGASDTAADSDTSSRSRRGCRARMRTARSGRSFPPALTAAVGYWATLSLNIPDFTRYARSQKSQVLGQALGLPTTMTAFAFIGVAVTSATIVIFGKPDWDPVVLVTRIGGTAVIIFAALVVLAAQLHTNMAANVVSPSNDFSNLSPKRISYVTGGLITAVVGILMMPWKLYSDAGAYIFTWLLGYSSLMGALGGILICRLLGAAQAAAVAARSVQGRTACTRIRNGVNRARDDRARRGGRCPSCRASCVRRRRRAASAEPGFFDHLYSYAWFVTFALSFVIYYVLMSGRALPATATINGEK